MLKITDMPIKTRVIKPWKSRKAISAGNLEFLRLSIRYNREIKNFMHLVPGDFLIT